MERLTAINCEKERGRKLLVVEYNNTTIRQMCTDAYTEIILHGSEPISSLRRVFKLRFLFVATIVWPRVYHSTSARHHEVSLLYINYYPHHVIPNSFSFIVPFRSPVPVNCFALRATNSFGNFFFLLSLLFTSSIENHLRVS